jgi:hypothetical protein
MLIEFTRSAGGSTVATIHRSDGVVLELRGYDRKFRIPHDLAHAVTERALGMADGVFGSIAGGAMFKGMTVVGGRPRHDAAARSRRILDANSRALTAAEVMAGVVHDAAEHGSADPSAKGRIDWGIVHPGPFPWSDDQVEAAVAALGDLSDRWSRDGRVEMDWPDRLTSRVPERAGVKRGRSGRR